MSTPRTVKIKIISEVKIKLIGLHGDHLQQLYDRYGILTANYFHTPKYKLGQWDGKIRFFTKNGDTYLFLIEEILPYLKNVGYTIQIEDTRDNTAYQPNDIDDQVFAHVLHPDSGEPVILRDYQVNGVNSLIQAGYGVCVAGTGAGKALSMDAQVLTSSGWVLNKDIEVGDKVSTPDGRGATVIGVYPQPIKQLYKVVFHDGSSVECCGEHLWDCFVPIKPHTAKTNRKIINTMDMIAFLDRKKSGVHMPGNISIPLCNAMELPLRSLPIAPYLVGALLGDGGLTQAITFSNRDSHILAKVAKLSAQFDVSLKPVTNSLCDYRLSKVEQQNSCPPSPNKLKQAIDELGINVRCDHKFIPVKYKQSSISQRWEIIQGLFDTDGTVDKKGNVSFTTVSYQLALDVQELVWSLGGVCTISSRVPTFVYKGEKKNGQLAYTCFVRHLNPKNFFSTFIKQSRCREVHADGRVPLSRRVIDIIPTKMDMSQCIMIDHPDHLYITNDYIVTHNTFMCAALVTAYDSLVEKSITIVPDQTLIRQTKRDYKLCELDTGEYSGNEKSLQHKHIVSTWQALQHNPDLIHLFDMVIVDECHGLRGNVLQKMITDQAGKIPYRFGFTGTIPKDPIEKMAVHLSVGPERFRIEAHELIERRVLSALHIDILQLEEDLHDEYVTWCQEECFGKPPTYAVFKDEYFADFSAEKSCIQRKQSRIDWISDFIKAKADQKKGNVLCLVDNIPFGRKIAANIEGAIFVNGQDVKDAKKRQAVYDMFATNDNLVVIATVHIAGTGLSINRIFNLVSVDIGKSFIRVIQAIGRGLRKAHDKDAVSYTDICSDLKYGKKHLAERIKFYKEAKYEFTKTVKQYENSIKDIA